METHLGPAMRLSAAEHRRLRRNYYWRRYLTAYLFLLPNFIFFFVFLVLPSWWVLYLSFHEGGILGAPRFVGLKNWWLIWQDKVAHRTLFNTVYYMLIAIPSVFVISMALALLLKRLMRGVAAIRAAIYFPTLSPIVLAALLWIFVIHPDFGILNFLLRLFGFEAVNWLGPGTALPTIAMLEVWRGTGFWTMLFLAALLSLPQELYDAAKIDGAGSWAQFPSIGPSIVWHRGIDGRTCTSAVGATRGRSPVCPASGTSTMISNTPLLLCWSPAASSSRAKRPDAADDQAI
jgi:ABC-type sugar transport system permease subunit